MYTHFHKYFALTSKDSFSTGLQLDKIGSCISNIAALYCLLAQRHFFKRPFLAAILHLPDGSPPIFTVIVCFIYFSALYRNENSNQPITTSDSIHYSSPKKPDLKWIKIREGLEKEKCTHIVCFAAVSIMYRYYVACVAMRWSFSESPTKVTF